MGRVRACSGRGEHGRELGGRELLGGQAEREQAVPDIALVDRVGRNRRDVAQRLHETLTGAGAPCSGS